MFTFGRIKEIEHAIYRVGNDEEAKLLINVINGVHDVLENKKNIENISETFKTALIEGKSGIWESSGSWLINLSDEYPILNKIWEELVQHPKLEVRFRVSAHLIDLPYDIAEKLYNSLSPAPASVPLVVFL